MDIEYGVIEKPEGVGYDEVDRRMKLFGRKVNLQYSSCRQVDIKWISEAGSIQIRPRYPNPKRVCTLEHVNGDDPGVKITHVAVPTDARIEVDGKPYHVFFDKF